MRTAVAFLIIIACFLIIVGGYRVFDAVFLAHDYSNWTAQAALRAIWESIWQPVQ